MQPWKQLALSAAQVRLETTTRQAKTADSLWDKKVLLDNVSLPKDLALLYLK